MTISPDQMGRLEMLYHQLIAITHKNENTPFKGTLLEGAGTLEVSILTLAEERPDIIIKEIGKELGVPPSTMTSAIDKLETKGFILRKISPRDRRSFALELTKLGFQAQEEHRSYERRLFGRILTCFDSPEERDSFLGLCEKLLLRFGGAPEKQS